MKIFNRFQYSLYLITLFFLVLSGFAQMPIFKRYYIADIPGFGWLAQFYVTHTIHYLSATVLIFLAFYALAGVYFKRTQFAGLMKRTGFHVFIIAILILTGALLVIKNLFGVYFGHNMIIALDIVHLGCCMLLLISGVYAVVRKKLETV